MQKKYAFAAMAMFAISAFSAQAADEGVTITFDPSNTTELTEFPAILTVNFEGPTSVKKPFTQALKVKQPGATNWVAFAADNTYGTSGWEATSCRWKTNSTVNRNLTGEYIVQVGSGITYNWADGTTTKSTVQEYTFIVKGSEQGGPETPELQPVQHDIVVSKYTPDNLNPFDLANKSIGKDGGGMLQITFNMGNLKAIGQPMVKITGPNYNQTALLQFSYTGGTTTTFKADFPADPKYDGAYVLTIPAEAVGDEEYIKDHAYGHTNAAIEYKFTCIGGKDPSTITEDLSFAPSLVTPAPGTKQETLTDVTFTFDQEVFFDAETEVKVGLKTDPNAQAFGSYGTAKFVRVDNKTLKVVFTPAPAERGEYQLNVPKGTFWDAARKNDPDKKAGAINDATPYQWNLSPVVAHAYLTSTVPTKGSRISGFAAGAQLVLNTDNNDLVKKTVISITEFKSGEELYSKSLGYFESTEKTAEGAPAVTFANALTFNSGCYYDIDYTFYGESGNVLDEGTFDFYGDTATGIEAIGADDASAARIFNLQGIELSGDINTLPAGIYVVGGKKVVIRK